MINTTSNTLYVIHYTSSYDRYDGDHLEEIHTNEDTAERRRDELRKENPEFMFNILHVRPGEEISLVESRRC